MAVFVGWALVAVLSVSAIVAALVAISLILIAFLVVFIEAAVATGNAEKALAYTECMGTAAVVHAGFHAVLSKMPEIWRKTLYDILGDFLGAYDISECIGDLSH